MTYKTADQQFRAARNRQAGMRLAKEALNKGEYTLAWQKARTYHLSAWDVQQLGLPEKYRPKDWKPRVPKAEGCA